MRREIRSLIKQAYPTNKYEERNTDLLDKYLKPGTVQSIAERLSQIRGLDVYFRTPDEGYDIYHDFKLCAPMGLEARLDDADSPAERARILKATPGMFCAMQLHVSRLGPYYRYFWNCYKAVRGRDQPKYFAEAPTDFWEPVERGVNEILRQFGLSRLSRRERGETVGWIDPGASIIAKGIVTVSNCLFSEIG